MNQSLVVRALPHLRRPSIGGLLRKTGEFTERTQKRYDDTALILDTILEHGLSSPPGRTALRRMNEMHGAYDISNDDKLYVLSTFVVMPIRWLDKYGWRRLTAAERAASVNYYRELGRHMGIRGIRKPISSSPISSTGTNKNTSPSTRAAWPAPKRRWR